MPTAQNSSGQDDRDAFVEQSSAIEHDPDHRGDLLRETVNNGACNRVTLRIRFEKRRHKLRQPRLSQGALMDPQHHVSDGGRSEVGAHCMPQQSGMAPTVLGGCPVSR